MLQTVEFTLEVEEVAVGHQDLHHQQGVGAQEAVVQVDKVELVMQMVQQVQLTLVVVEVVEVVKTVVQEILVQVQQVVLE